MAKRILIADDQPAARELLRSALENAGYEVFEAGNGDEAVDQAEKSIPDLILLDIQMPGRDGFQVCQALKSNPCFAKVPIVAMTAGLMHGEKERALSNGFSEFLGKPISIRTLRQTVAALLS